MVRFLTLLAVVVVLLGCGSNQIQLNFSTIEKEDSAGTGIYYELQSPRMTVVATEADIDSLEGIIKDPAKNELRNIDFGDTFVLVVFQGMKGSLGYGVTVTQILQTQNQVDVYAEFEEPQGGAADAISSPYQVVAVNKTVQGYTQFNLIVDNQTVFSESWDIP
jgi:hypothetical protein